MGEYFGGGKYETSPSYYKEMCSEETRTLFSPETVILSYLTS